MAAFCCSVFMLSNIKMCRKVGLWICFHGGVGYQPSEKFGWILSTRLDVGQYELQKVIVSMMQVALGCYGLTVYSLSHLMRDRRQQYGSWSWAISPFSQSWAHSPMADNFPGGDLQDWLYGDCRHPTARGLTCQWCQILRSSTLARSVVSTGEYCRLRFAVTGHQWLQDGNTRQVGVHLLGLFNLHF